MIYEKFLNTSNDAGVMFDICIPCWENSHKLDETISNIIESNAKAQMPVKFIIGVDKQSVVKNRMLCMTRSRSPLVLWLDDDIKFQEQGWDKYLYDRITSNSTLGIVGINVVHYRANTNAPTRPEGDTTNVCGAVMMSRKVLGVDFDVNYIGSQWEDTDYCLSMIKHGYKVYQDNGIRVIHYNEEKNRDYIHNKAYFNKKWNLNW